MSENIHKKEIQEIFENLLIFNYLLFICSILSLPSKCLYFCCCHASCFIFFLCNCTRFQSKAENISKNLKKDTKKRNTTKYADILSIYLPRYLSPKSPFFSHCSRFWFDYAFVFFMLLDGARHFQL